MKIFKNLKNKTQDYIKHIKTMFYAKLCARLKTTYGYYYYLCFKEFFKKLLKPKKMIAIKWRTKTNEDFQYVTYIEKNLITRYIGRIRNNVLFGNDDTFQFRFKNSPISPTSIYLNNIIDISIKPKNDFYFVEKKCLIECKLDDFNDNSLVFYLEDFSHFKIGNSEWMPIENIDYRFGGLCLFSFDYKLFIKIDDNLIGEPNNSDFGNLIEKDLGEFINNVQKIK